MESDHGSVVAVHNLGDEETDVLLGLDAEPLGLFGDATSER